MSKELELEELINKATNHRLDFYELLKLRHIATELEKHDIINLTQQQIDKRLTQDNKPEVVERVEISPPSKNKHKKHPRR
jgi:hypothetical protein